MKNICQLCFIMLYNKHKTLPSKMAKSLFINGAGITKKRKNFLLKNIIFFI